MVPAGLFTVKSRFRMENILFSAGALFLMLLFPLIFQSVPASNPDSDVKIPVPVSQGIENTDATTISHEEVVQAYFKKKVFPFRKLKETISDETAYHSSGFGEYGKLSLVPAKTFVYNADFKDDTISKITSSTTPSIAKLVFLQDDIFAIKFKNSSKKIKNFVLTTRHFLIFVVSLCVLFWGIFSDHDFNKKACKKIGHSLR
jgi:hypothetical protein